jgi:hypothetical protein
MAPSLATYRRLRQLLSVTLGVVPSTASEALFRVMAPSGVSAQDP